MLNNVRKNNTEMIHSQLDILKLFFKISKKKM